MKLLVTGGAGFIGSNFIRYLLAHRPGVTIVNLDKLTYAGTLSNLAGLPHPRRHRFVRGDVADAATVDTLLARFGRADAIVHFAAETHVDRSLEDAAPFLRTNVVGTHVLLEAARRHRIPRFLHISTDEVYGPAPPRARFREDAPLRPRNPYAASKAAADLLVLSYVRSYGLPAIIARCSNNFGPYQFPEKLIPLALANALEDKPVPLYGDGLHVRDWLYVTDTCRAIHLLLARGAPGEIYNVGGVAQRTNLAVVRAILRGLGKPSRIPKRRDGTLIQFVEDRPGHDRRYALDSRKIRKLGWKPQYSFEAPEPSGLRQTIAWYRTHTDWLNRARSGTYRNFYARHYLRRPHTLAQLTPPKT